MVGMVSTTLSSNFCQVSTLPTHPSTLQLWAHSLCTCTLAQSSGLGLVPSSDLATLFLFHSVLDLTSQVPL